MTKLVCGLLIGLILLVPSPAVAGELKLNIAVARQEDGATTGELRYNDRVVWRLKLCSDGAQPVAGQAGGNTTVVVPDIEDGLFLLKVYNQ